jgi:hypothetical protein
MMKVLYYSSSTNIHSGASQWMFRLAKGMQEQGHQTIAVLPKKEEGIAETNSGGNSGKRAKGQAEG